MIDLSKIARTATPGIGVQFRKEKYGSEDIRSFLRDVVALANAPVEGPRYIIVGAEIDAKGSKQLYSIDAEDFSGDPSYQSLANEYIEPPLRIRYKPASLEGKRVGVFEIGDAQDRPYMMRIDYSETLRRGDAYVRGEETVMKMGRRQLSDLFVMKFRDSVSADDLEVGFAGEIIHKDLKLNCYDLSQLPSAEASNKLNQLIEIQSNSPQSGPTPEMARLTHARLFGSDDPYVHRSKEQLMQEIKDLRNKYRDPDNHFLFESNGQPVQMVVYNQGNEPIIDASLSLIMPNHDAFFIADSLPKIPGRKGFTSRSPDEIATYPSVTVKDDSVKVTSKIGDIPVGQPLEIFESELLLCAGKELAGKRYGIRYALHAQNLRTPAKGQLKLHFED
jgi:hypothetical protein